MTKKKEESEEEIIPTITEESSELGTIRINHSVVAGIVRLATQSVKGVVNVGGGVVEGLTNFFSKKESEEVLKLMNRPREDMRLKSSSPKFGVDLAKIGTSIQEAIRDQILAMTGNHAKTIDVVVDDIKMDSGDKDSEEENWSSSQTTSATQCQIF